MAGVGYALLRQAYPDHLPSILSGRVCIFQDVRGELGRNQERI
jgi:hypothetical protein